MLARPLRRSELVVGRWLGLSIVVGRLRGAVGPARDRRRRRSSAATSRRAAGRGRHSSRSRRSPCSRSRSTLGTRLPAIAAGAIIVVLFGLGWFAGVLGNVAVAFDARPLARASARSPDPVPDRRPVARRDLRPGAAARAAPAGRDAAALRANPFFAPRRRRVAFTAWRVVWVVLVLPRASPCSAAASSDPRAPGLGAGERAGVEQVRRGGSARRTAPAL